MATGSLEDRDPFIEIRLIRGSATHTVKCLIDTGFTGFLSLPQIIADQIQINSNSVLSISYADGETDSRGSSSIEAEINGVRRIGLAIIETNAEHVLLGMLFLVAFDLMLIIDPANGIVQLLQSKKAQGPMGR